jgi:predicted GNAT family acetyltransferase
MIQTRTIDVTDSNVEAARSFLVEHAETSLFLLSNLTAHGPRLGESMNSGNYRYIEHAGKVVAVFALTRRGNLLAQTGGREDLAAAILQACEAEPVPIKGVVGEWTVADALWRRLCSNPGFQPVHTSKEILHRIVLEPSPVHQAHRGVRRLAASDFERWEPLNTAYLIEEGLPVQVTLDQRRESFIGQASEGHWWGLLESARLVAIAGLNATFESVGQVGGVYTVPEKRRKGLARAVMLALSEDAKTRLGMKKLILFTGEHNTAARRLYESLGFTQIGHFGLLFGSPRARSDA